MQVGVIGLGKMGSGMVRALLEAGHTVTVYDVSGSAVDRIVEMGAIPEDSSAEVGAAAEVVLMSLPSPQEVFDAVGGESGLLSLPTRNLVIVDTSTVDPATTRRLATDAAATGVAYLDAPVLGRPDACGEWTLPVGGERSAFEAARPVLETIASRIYHVGEAGTGNAIKLLNSLMFGAINVATAEMFAAAALIGVSPRTLYEIISESRAATMSPLFRELGEKILDRDFSPVFTVELLCKDNSLAMKMIEEAGGSLVLGNTIRSLNSLVRSAGYGDEDTGAITKLYEKLLNVSISAEAGHLNTSVKRAGSGKAP